MILIDLKDRAGTLTFHGKFEWLLSRVAPASAWHQSRLGFAGCRLFRGDRRPIAATPDYLRKPLAHFNPNVPAGWAYTLDDQPQRPDHGRALRSHPAVRRPVDAAPASRPAAQRARNWKSTPVPPGCRLRRHPGQLPKGRHRTRQHQAGARGRGTGADFTGDVPRASRAGAGQNAGPFAAATLTVNKQPAYVEKYVLDLTEPYWPVLGVKMNELHASRGRFSRARVATGPACRSAWSIAFHRANPAHRQRGKSACHLFGLHPRELKPAALVSYHVDFRPQCTALGPSPTPP